MGVLPSGGSWACSAIMPLEELTATETSVTLIIPKTTGANDTLAVVGWPMTTRAVGIVLQRSCPRWCCRMHCMDLQHCMACSALAVGLQSTA